MAQPPTWLFLPCRKRTFRHVLLQPSDINKSKRRLFALQEGRFVHSFTTDSVRISLAHAACDVVFACLALHCLVHSLTRNLPSSLSCCPACDAHTNPKPPACVQILDLCLRCMLLHSVPSCLDLITCSLNVHGEVVVLHFAYQASGIKVSQPDAPASVESQKGRRGQREL